MANEEQIKAEMRFYAIEWMVSKLWAVFLKSQGGGTADVEKIREQMSQAAHKKAFSSLDPSTSDHYSAEMEAAIDRLLVMAKATLGPNS